MLALSPPSSADRVLSSPFLSLGAADLSDLRAQVGFEEASPRRWDASCAAPAPTYSQVDSVFVLL